MRPFELPLIRNSSKIEWFRNQNFSFNKRFQPVFAEMITQNGMGFTFNLLDADKLMRFDT